jgi:membrane associated rhomboid family serine protease
LNDQPYLSWFDFDAMHGRTYSNPYFTYTIMLLSTIALIWSFALNDWKIAPFNVNPMAGPSPEVLLEMGALERSLIIDENQWYRVVAPLILHAGIIHYVINMLAFWLLVSGVERMHGTFEVALVYCFAGIGGNVLSALFLTNAISVGSSGGIFGIIGLCTSDIIVNWELIRIQDKEHPFSYTCVFSWLAFEVLLNICIGLTPYVDNFAHLGGWFYGICIGLVVIEPLNNGFFGPIQKWRYDAWRVVGMVLTIGTMAFTIVLLWQLDDAMTTFCPNCRYISCAPFPFWKQDKWWYCDGCSSVTANLITASDGSAELEIDCPYGDTATVIFDSGESSPEMVEPQIESLCRQLCDLN